MLTVFGEIPNRLVRYDNEHREEDFAKSDIAELNFVPQDYEEVRGLEEDRMTKFGCTLSICPHRRINSRKWMDYTHSEQMTLLVKIVNSVGKYGIFVDYAEIVFEVCPSLRMLHVHFTANAIKDYMLDFIIDINKKYSPKDYTTFKAVGIYNDDGWFQYMRKNTRRPCGKYYHSRL